ncbi:hypothetical protein A8L59_16340 [Pseudomonas koreensis]|uniref:Uncharacterized protein n=1 Tax=Pseudomonas koreensis TaxID=198620 RepID=A0AAC9C134_9PSED|nr:hypothetical protein A8L59_16340 [Pseudomonas koreensis]
MPVDPLYIEDTDDWLGNPTSLETCRHQLRMYENEFEALTLKLERAVGNIQGLVRDNDALTAERNSLRDELIAAKANAADADRRANDITIKTNWELMAKDRHISHLATELQTLKGETPFSPSIPYRRDDS